MLQRALGYCSLRRRTSCSLAVSFRVAASLDRRATSASMAAATLPASAVISAVKASFNAAFLRRAYQLQFIAQWHN